MFSGKLGIRYTYPKGMARPFVELGADFSGMINAKIKIMIRARDGWMVSTLAITPMRE